MSIYFHFALLSVHNPVLQYAAAAIEFQFRLAISLLIGESRRQNLDNQLRSGVEFSVISQRLAEFGIADPDKIGCDIVILGENHAGRGVNDSHAGLLVPLI